MKHETAPLGGIFTNAVPNRNPVLFSRRTHALLRDMTFTVDETMRQYPAEDKTLADAWMGGLVPRVRCLRGKRIGPVKVEPCGYSSAISLSTLIWTRGARFPCHLLARRLKCPRCGGTMVEVGWFPEALPYERATRSFYECEKAAKAGSVLTNRGRVGYP